MVYIIMHYGPSPLTVEMALSEQSGRNILYHLNHDFDVMPVKDTVILS